MYCAPIHWHMGQYAYVHGCVDASCPTFLLPPTDSKICHDLCRPLVVMLSSKTAWDTPLTVHWLSFIAQRLQQEFLFSTADLWEWLCRHAVWHGGSYASWHLCHYRLVMRGVRIGPAMLLCCAACLARYVINEQGIQQVSPTFCRLVSVKTSFRATL